MMNVNAGTRLRHCKSGFYARNHKGLVKTTKLTKISQELPGKAGFRNFCMFFMTIIIARMTFIIQGGVTRE
jgi:hypothetical protein